jgi:hypothetical protein
MNKIKVESGREWEVRAYPKSSCPRVGFTLGYSTMDVYKAGAIDFRQCSTAWVDDIPALVAHAQQILKGEAK